MQARRNQVLERKQRLQAEKDFESDTEEVPEVKPKSNKRKKRKSKKIYTPRPSSRISRHGNSSDEEDGDKRRSSTHEAYDRNDTRSRSPIYSDHFEEDED